MGVGVRFEGIPGAAYHRRRFVVFEEVQDALVAGFDCRYAAVPGLRDVGVLVDGRLLACRRVVRRGSVVEEVPRRIRFGDAAPDMAESIIAPPQSWGK